MVLFWLFHINFFRTTFLGILPPSLAHAYHVLFLLLLSNIKAHHLCPIITFSKLHLTPKRQHTHQALGVWLFVLFPSVKIIQIISSWFTRNVLQFILLSTLSELLPENSQNPNLHTLELWTGLNGGAPSWALEKRDWMSMFTLRFFLIVFVCHVFIWNMTNIYFTTSLFSVFSLIFCVDTSGFEGLKWGARSITLVEHLPSMLKVLHAISALSHQRPTTFKMVWKILQQMICFEQPYFQPQR